VDWLVPLLLLSVFMIATRGHCIGEVLGIEHRPSELSRVLRVQIGGSPEIGSASLLDGSLSPYLLLFPTDVSDVRSTMERRPALS
jgi:hypothetical protein